MRPTTILGRDAARSDDRVGPGTRCDALLISRSHRRDHASTGPSCELNGTGTDRTGPALYQHHAAVHRPRDVDTAIRGNAGDAEAGPLLEGDRRRAAARLARWDDDVLGGRAERPVALGPIAPHPLPDPRRGHAIPHAIDDPAPSLWGMTRGYGIP